jgi:hypothetical protein
MGRRIGPAARIGRHEAVAKILQVAERKGRLRCGVAHAHENESLIRDIVEKVLIVGIGGSS